MSLFQKQGAHVDYNDPFVPELPMTRRYSFAMKSVPLDATIGSYDVVVIATDHSSYDYGWIHEHAVLIVDTRNAIKGKSGGKLRKA